MVHECEGVGGTTNKSGYIQAAVVRGGVANASFRGDHDFRRRSNHRKRFYAIGWSGDGAGFYLIIEVEPGGQRPYELGPFCILRFANAFWLRRLGPCDWDWANRSETMGQNFDVGFRGHPGFRFTPSCGAYNGHPAAQ